MSSKLSNRKTKSSKEERSKVTFDELKDVFLRHHEGKLSDENTQHKMHQDSSNIPSGQGSEIDENSPTWQDTRNHADYFQEEDSSLVMKELLIGFHDLTGTLFENFSENDLSSYIEKDIMFEEFFEDEMDSYHPTDSSVYKNDEIRGLREECYQDILVDRIIEIDEYNNFLDNDEWNASYQIDENDDEF